MTLSKRQTNRLDLLDKIPFKFLLWLVDLLPMAGLKYLSILTSLLASSVLLLMADAARAQALACPANYVPAGYTCVPVAGNPQQMRCTKAGAPTKLCTAGTNSSGSFRCPCVDQLPCPVSFIPAGYSCVVEPNTSNKMRCTNSNNDVKVCTAGTNNSGSFICPCVSINQPPACP